MKTITLLAFAGLFSLYTTSAQTPAQLFKTIREITPEEEVYSIVPVELEFDSTDSNAWFPDLKNYVAEHAQYPSSAHESGLEGVVEAEATVGADGYLTDIEVVKGLNQSCDNVVKRLLSEMPAWNPARRNGQPIKQRVTVRVRFRLQPF